jgi:hypothetical protein
VPLSRNRKGEDVMLTDALGFDLRVYDPGAPLFAHSATETVLEPTDPAWLDAITHRDNRNVTNNVNSSLLGKNNADSNATFPLVGQGAYVDLGYGFNKRAPELTPPWNALLPTPIYAPAFSTAIAPWFFAPQPLSDVYGNQLAPFYWVLDTWSFHYENNGLNEDNDATFASTGAWVHPYDPADVTHRPSIDEAVNGLEDAGNYWVPNATPPPALVVGQDSRLGPDDVGERETAPPYDKPLRGMQVVLRLYERDSRQIRQVSVNQSFVPE